MNILRCHRIRCWLAVLLLATPLSLFAQPATGVGFAAITIHDPVNGDTMPGYVFYPTTHAGGLTWVGPYELHATRDAPPTPGAKPLVVISHGHGGSDLGTTTWRSIWRAMDLWWRPCNILSTTTSTPAGTVNRR